MKGWPLESRTRSKTCFPFHLISALPCSLSLVRSHLQKARPPYSLKPAVKIVISCDRHVHHGLLMMDQYAQTNLGCRTSFFLPSYLTQIIHDSFSRNNSSDNKHTLTMATGQTVNGHAKAILSVSALFSVLAIAFVMLRIHARMIILKSKLTTDDILIIFGLVS